MNTVIMMGRLTRDPEIRPTTTGNVVASFSIAVDRRFKREGEPEADFFNCTAFGRTAEFVEKYFTKGKKILLTGSIQNDNYTNKDGQKVYATKIIVENVEFAASKNAEQTTPAEPAQTSDGFMSIPEGDLDELPFA